MKIRNLMLKDAPLMLEWMHDNGVTEFMEADFANKTIDDCERFIKYADENRDTDMHLAITDDNDEYMGTVSLKHIDSIKKTAEFAISVRKAAMGKGYAIFAMSAILRLGSQSLGIDSIYWCVSVENKRAIRFYDKNGYERTEDVPENVLKEYTEEQRKKYIWYVYR